MKYLGDFAVGGTVRFMWSSNDSAGASITRATNGTVSVYKNLGVTQSPSGVTDTEDFGSLPGIHACAIDTSADGTFYSTGADFTVVLSAATIDGKTVNAVLAEFSIENRTPLRPTTAGSTLDVAATGEAGVDLDNIKEASTYTATIKLKQLDIQNSAGSALVATSTGGGGHGVLATGNGIGNGIEAAGGSSGIGLRGIGQGAGAGIAATGGATGHGLEATGGATSGDGINATATTLGDGIDARGAGSGDGIAGRGGATNGAGFYGLGGGSGGGAELLGGSTAGPGVYALGAGAGADIQGDLTD